jgi:hypothetical protein
MKQISKQNTQHEAGFQRSLVVALALAVTMVVLGTGCSAPLSVANQDLSSLNTTASTTGLQMYPNGSTVSVSSPINFSAINGKGPFTYTVVSGGGSIDANSGYYVAPASATFVELSVSDKTGARAYAYLTVSSGAGGVLSGPRTITLTANDARLSHPIGGLDGNGWSASVNSNYGNGNYLVTGPNATDWGGAYGSATFQMLIDINYTNNDLVATAQIYDATTNEIISFVNISRQQFAGEGTMQTFAVPNFDLTNRVGHSIQTRVYWSNKAYIAVGTITVNLSN